MVALQATEGENTDRNADSRRPVAELVACEVLNRRVEPRGVEPPTSRVRW